MNIQKGPKPLVGRATYISGEMEEFTDADVFIRRIKEELHYHITTGFRYKVLRETWLSAKLRTMPFSTFTGWRTHSRWRIMNHRMSRV